MRVDNDGFRAFVVDISKRSRARKVPHLGFVQKTAFGITAELVAILLSLHKLVAEIRFALRRVLEPKSSEFEVGQEAFVEEVDDFSAILAVASEAVRMPCDDA